MTELSPLAMILIFWFVMGAWIIVRGRKALQHPMIADLLGDLTQAQRMQLAALMVIVTIIFWPFVLILIYALKEKGE